MTEAEKIERIDMSEKEIKSALSDFFKKNNLVFKKKSEKGFVWGNNTYNLNFVYAPERYFWFIFQGIKIKIEDKAYNFSDIISFIQKERKEEFINTYQELSAFKRDEKYMESYLIPFLKMENNIEKMEAYLNENYPWHTPVEKKVISKMDIIREKMNRFEGFRESLIIPSEKEIAKLKTIGLSKEYIEFITEFGFTIVLEDLLNFLITPKEVFWEETGKVILFGDNLAGELFVFSTQDKNKVYVVLENGKVLKEFSSFFDFIIYFLDDMLGILQI